MKSIYKKKQHKMKATNIFYAIIQDVIHYLNDDDKLNVMSLCKYAQYIRVHFTLKKNVIYKKNIWYLNYITNLTYHEESQNTCNLNLVDAAMYPFFDFASVNIHIPVNLRRLRFNKFNRELASLPPKLTHLHLGNYFNHTLTAGILPETLIHLNLGWKYNKSIDNILPAKLVCLIFGVEFNTPIKSLPNSIERIVFGHNFDQPINSLPQNLKFLAFGFKFNQSINCNLPPGLTKLSFGKEYNKMCDLKYHANLTYIRFVSINSFSVNMVELLPLNLKYLKLIYDTNYINNIILQIKSTITDREFHLILNTSQRLNAELLPNNLKIIYE